MKGIEDLVAVSRKYGQDSRFVIAGGGNTSYKDADRLWVKASGHALATITEDGFAVLDRSLLNPMGEKRYSSDVAEREAQVKNDLANACLTKDRRPSVETSLHNCMEAAFVVHLHPTLVNGLMCSAKAETLCEELFPEAIYVAYTDPGYTLFKKVYDKIKAYRKEKGCEPKVIFLQNHGIFVGAEQLAPTYCVSELAVSDVFLRQIVALDDGLDGARHVENGMLIHSTAFLIDEMFAGIYGLVARHLGRTACCHMERLVAFAVNTIITIHKANLLRRSFHHDASSAITEDRTGIAVLIIGH